MPLYGERLFASETWLRAKPEAKCAAITLWWRAWTQCPAGSLPDDDHMLAHLAGYGSAVGAWKRIRQDAIRGFVTCDDGRLYHPLLCSEARVAWERRKKEREKMRKWRERRGLKNTDNQQEIDACNGNETVTLPFKNRDVTSDRTGQDKEVSKKDSCAPAAPPLELALGEEGTVVPGEPPAKVHAVQLEADFRAFYAAYPRKKAPDAARRAYAKARRTASAAQILAAVHRERWAEDKNFVPYPASWLNAGEWREEVDMPAAGPGRAVDARFIGWEGMDHLWLKRWRSAPAEAREGMLHTMSIQAPKALKYIQGGGE